MQPLSSDVNPADRNCQPLKKAMLTKITARSKIKILVFDDSIAPELKLVLEKWPELSVDLRQVIAKMA